MLRRSLAAAVLALLIAAPAAHAVKPLHVQGGRLADENGRTVILHGVNVVFKPPPYYPHGSAARTSFNARDVARLRAWGFDTIRLGITWKALMPQPGVLDRGYLRRIVAVARVAEQGAMFVLLDMHQDMYAERFQGNGAPDWAIKDDGIAFQSLGGFPLNYAAPAVGRSFTNFYENRDGIRTQYKRAWEAVARAVRGDPHVLGFDLMNEPSCELQVNPPCAIPPAAAAYSRWLLPLYDDLIPALRRADPTHPSFYEEGVTVNFGYPMLIGRPPLPRWRWRGAVLSHHVYCSTAFRAVPCSRQEPDAFAQARASIRRNGIAPLVTEFGATDDLAVLRRITGLADRFGEGWQYWQYKAYGDPTTSASTESGGADAESLITASGRVKAAKLRVLARVYPSSIAGTGASWSFNDRTGVFRMRWRAGSGSTQIVLPSVWFPHGARVTLHARGGFFATRHSVAVGARGPATVTIRPR